ncbi:MAG: cytochrome C [Desulfamplus sp.]|nr:cytochrome C [Desulfamplus sp.]
MEQTSLYAKASGLIQQGRSDGIVIDLAAIPGGDQMPGVTFFHDLHTEQVKKNDCSVCHLKENDRFVFKFKRLKDTDTKTDMAIYHDNCVACHAEVKSSGKKGGPLEAQCRDCHNTNSDLVSTWNPVEFDKSLHNRHEKSKSIVGTAKSITDAETKQAAGTEQAAVAEQFNEETNCSACHHSYDEKTQKIFYEKGKEDSCLYCHKDVKVDKADSMRNVSHNACVNCHFVEMKDFAGPIDCKGCHDLEAQKKIQKLQDVPRLKRDQPDMAIITGLDPALKSPEEIAKASRQLMNHVVFDHQNHEKMSKNCRTCHHDSLENCKECHTATGSEKGGFVKLEKAMHDNKSDQSCIGCHNSHQKAADCAGCHDQVPKKSFSDNDRSCSTCHGVDTQTIDLTTMDKAAVSDTARKIVEERNNSFKKVADDKIPEKVSIGYIADKYEASDFPHSKIIKSIQKRIEKNSMARTFHGDETVLCMGCHHNSPATEKPQKCGSCHGKADTKGDGRPGLKGAYHGQCITCHQKMNIEAVAATDCNKCHKEKK